MRLNPDYLRLTCNHRPPLKLGETDVSPAAAVPQEPGAAVRGRHFRQRAISRRNADQEKDGLYLRVRPRADVRICGTIERNWRYSGHLFFDLAFGLPGFDEQA